MPEERWKNLDIWKLADSLAYNIYLATRKFPKDEVYGISSQLRRAALSVPTNIVEFPWGSPSYRGVEFS